MAKKNDYPKNREPRLPDLGAREHYEREKVYIKEYRNKLDGGKWVVIGCEDHVYVGRIWLGAQHVVDAALQNFWSDGSLLANKATGQIVRIGNNGKGPEIEIVSPEILTEIQRRRYRDYTIRAEK